MQVQNHALICGRRIDFFCHPSEPEWGYKKTQYDSFAVIYPRDYSETEKYPLDVVFHSAGHDLYSTLTCIMEEGSHDIYHTPNGMFSLILDCRANMNDWWWGGINALDENYDRRREGTELQPVENRCIATVEWVIDNFPVDCDRVYAVGNSMGGSGCLGIALRRGDIFAAIKANVPAGARHAVERCCLLGNAPEGFSIPDPPVVVDYSSQIDEWSVEHELLFKGMKARRYAYHAFWGLFGHGNNHAEIAKYNDLIHSIPAREMRKCDAYPVFTDASTDDIIPWLDRENAPDSGQVNGFFHWKVVSDTAEALEMKLWLLSPDEWQTRVTLPEKSVADILIRRMQNFKLSGGEEFNWSFGGQSGTSKADSTGHPSIERICVTQTPQILKITK